MNNIKKISLTSKEVEEELKRETYKGKYFNILRSTIFTLVVIAAFALLIATIMLPVLEVSSSSMSPLLNEGDIVVAVKTNKLQYGDVIAFYHGNKILTKRVIAGSGSWVTIDDDGNVYVDNEKLEEEYINKKTLGDSDIEYPYQVKSEEWFVLSDNRENTIDSRKKEVGCVSKENIIGKVLFKIWPFN